MGTFITGPDPLPPLKTDQPGHPPAGLSYEIDAADINSIWSALGDVRTAIASATISGLTGDVTASGSGSVAATVARVGGSTAALLHSAELLANAATPSNTASTLVMRDASGNFSANTFTSTYASGAAVQLSPNGKVALDGSGSALWADAFGTVNLVAVTGIHLGGGSQPVAVRGPGLLVASDYGQSVGIFAAADPSSIGARSDYGANASFRVFSHQADSAGAVGLIFDNDVLLGTAGSKLVSFRNNGLERSFIDRDGNFNGGVTPMGGLSVATLQSPSGLSLANATTGGTLAPGTYGYRVAAFNSIGDTLASGETTITVPAGTSTNAVTVSWTGSVGATGYKIFGRTPSAELLIASVAGGSTVSYVDTGSLTPAGTLPSQNHAKGINGINFGNSPIQPVTGVNSSATVGTLAPGFYQYSIGALGAFGETPAVAGPNLSLATAGGFNITWTPSVGATGYAIYRAAGNNYQGPLLIATAGGQATASFTDDGSLPQVHIEPAGFNTTAGLNFTSLPAPSGIGAAITIPNGYGIVADSRTTYSPGAYIYFTGYHWTITASEGITMNKMRVTGTPGDLQWFPNVPGVNLKLGASSQTTDWFSSDNHRIFAGSAVQIPGAMLTGGLAMASMGAPALGNLYLSSVATGGTLASGTYFYCFTIVTPGGESLPSPVMSVVVPAGTSTNKVLIQLPWSPTPMGVVAFNVYGRTDGAGQLVGAVNPVSSNAGVPMVVTDAGQTLGGLVPTTDRSGDVVAGMVLAGYLPTPAAPQILPNYGGALTGGTDYFYRITALNSAGETLPSAEARVTNAYGGNALFWTQVAGATSYKVYGRSQGAEQLLGTVPGVPTASYNGLVFFYDNGAVSPSGAMPTANTARVSAPLAINQGSTQKMAFDACGKLHYPTGAGDAVVGTGTLASGVAAISTTSVTPASKVFLTHAGATTSNAGVLWVQSITAGVSFSVASSNSADTDSFNWFLVN